MPPNKSKKGVSWAPTSILPELTDREYRPGGQRWRETSASLHGRLRGSIVDTLTTLQGLYPTTWSDYSPRPTGYVSWLSRQICDLYTRSPQITYVDPDSGEPLDTETTKAIARIRAAAGVEQALQGAHEEAAGPGNGVIWVVPVVRATDGGQLLGVRCIVVPAHDQDVLLVDHPESEDERDVDVWRVRLPLPGLTSRSGVARITKTEATWEEGEGLEGQPVWHRADDTQASNPLGQIPAVLLRWSTPLPGAFWSAAREDVLWTARSLDVAHTDQGLISRMQGFGQWWARGLNKKSGEIKMGPGELIELMDGTTTAIGCESPKPDLAGTTTALESYTRVAIASQDLNPASLLRSTAITAEGKKIELSDRESLRQRHVTQLARAEQRIYDLMRAWLRVLRGVDVLPAAKLHVTYSTPEMPGDPLHELQAMERRLQLGQSNPYTEYARSNNVSVEEAQRIVDENIAISKRLGIFTTKDTKPDTSIVKTLDTQETAPASEEVAA